MTFLNEAVAPADLPQLASVPFHPLSTAWRKVELLSTTGWYVLMLLGAGVYLGANTLGWRWWMLLLLTWSAALSVSLWLAWKRWEKAGYALRTHDILYQEGVIFTSRTVVPYNRVQHCEVSRGPLERWTGLATLRIYTAGSTGGDLQVGGLPYMDALRIKEFVTAQAGTMPVASDSKGYSGTDAESHA
ncbi:MAG: hypothetical protein RLY31_232 [Bacteroidota bacterium]